MKTKYLLFVILGASLFFSCDKSLDGLEGLEDLESLEGLRSAESSDIFYPEEGVYGPNILADDVVSVLKTGFDKFEYSVRAEFPAGSRSSLKIKISLLDPEDLEKREGMGITYVHNWAVSNVRENFTLTVIESGRLADASVTFFNDCIIEFYENGATEPTKVKEIKVMP